MRTRSAVAKENESLVRSLEERFRKVSLLLYDTTVPVQVLEQEVFPFLDENVSFVDPWQQASGRDKYRRGAAGFHCMFRFDFDLFQINVQVDEAQSRGRAIVDGVMNLKQLQWLYTYPLRTILTYEFVLEGTKPIIQVHEEMWSFGDMIEAIPGLGRFYKTVFRPAFSQGFLVASEVCRRLR